MAYTVSNAQTKLSYRLGESAAPSVVSELTKRRDWFNEAGQIIYSKKPMWFMQTIGAISTVAYQPKYSFPTDFRKEYLIYLDGKVCQKIDVQDINEHPELVNDGIEGLYYRPSYYTVENSFYLLPTPDTAPTTYAVTSITASGTTATVTTTEEHSLATNDYVTIAGADQTEYNVKAQITYISSTSFSYTISGSPVSPATGTITYYKHNIEIWYEKEFTPYTADTDALQIPDKYINALVAYAEGRYWSSAHTRGKSSDAFLEFESILKDMNDENTRRSFKTGLI